MTFVAGLSIRRTRRGGRRLNPALQEGLWFIIRSIGRRFGGFDRGCWNGWTRDARPRGPICTHVVVVEARPPFLSSLRDCDRSSNGSADYRLVSSSIECWDRNVSTSLHPSGVHTIVDRGWEGGRRVLLLSIWCVLRFEGAPILQADFSLKLPE